MCKHIRYRYDLCANKENYKATRPFCIEPCPKAYNEAGEFDFELGLKCPDNKIENVGSGSGCLFRRDEGKGYPCWSCSPKGDLEPDDPGFADWIQQGRPGKRGGTLPTIDEMVWHVAARKMLLPILNDFTWDQPRKTKRKRNDGEDEEDDDAMSVLLSPKSKAPSEATLVVMVMAIQSTRSRCTVGRASSSESEQTSATAVTTADATTNSFEEAWSWSAKPRLTTVAAAASSSTLATSASAQSFVTATDGMSSSPDSFVTAPTKPCGLLNGSEEEVVWREEFWEVL